MHQSDESKKASLSVREEIEKLKEELKAKQLNLEDFQQNTSKYFKISYTFS